jgi:hypothetical protein
MDTDSEFVENLEDNKLNHPTDSVYSVMGIIYKLQTIADRTVLLGELRGDLTVTTDAASADLKAIADFTVDTRNAYNRISDYYAVINNCNYFLKNVDTALVKNDRRVFEYEYAAVKAFRAWTYLQAALVYGRIPLVTEPLLTEAEARKAMEGSYAGIKEICDYFIDDLKPYVDTKLPRYGQVDDKNSQKFFIPVRALLGDLCLWAGYYEDAARFYHDYLSLRTAPIPTGTNSARWYDAATKEFRARSMSLSYSQGSSECLSYIPMEGSKFYGVYSQLNDIFNSNYNNNQYVQVEPSEQMHRISAAQNYCAVITLPSGAIDTIYAPKENLYFRNSEGDLRFCSTYTVVYGNADRFSRVNGDFQSISKYSQANDGVTTYRTSMVYLRYAEALNRAGYPESAFAVLKYGLNANMVAKWISEEERTAAAPLISFDIDYFPEESMQGIHSRGSGRADCDTLYVLPQPTEELASRQDTIDYQIPLVENLIIDEMALEGAFEGYRYYDLMRVALRRNDPAYLADPISRRSGDVDESLRTLLLDQKNWYLPVK